MADVITTEWDALEWAAGLVGKTSAEIYNSGNDWSEVYSKIAELYPDKQATYIIHNNAGEAVALFNRTTGTTSFYSGGASTGGTTYASNNLVTTIEQTTTETGSKIGEAVSGATDKAASDAAKKGAALGGVTMKQAVFSGMAVLGGVAKGVEWYKDNPDFWESLSHKLLPFAYGDQYGDGSSDSWAGIFEKAIIPTAVGADGKTYLPENFLNALAQEMVMNGAYTMPTSTTTLPDELKHNLTYPNAYGAIYTGSEGVINGNVKVVISKNPDGKCVIVSNRFIQSGGSVSGAFYAVGSSGVSYQIGIYYGSSPSYYNFTGTMGNVYSFSGEDTVSPPVSQISNGSIGAGGGDLQYILKYGETVDSTPITNVSPENGAIYPQNGVPISQTYPDWASRALQTVDPSSTPDNTTYNNWYPVSITNDNPAERTGTSTANQQQAQTGDNPSNSDNPNEQTNAQNKILEAIQTLVQTLTKLDIPTDTTPPTDTTGTGGTPTPPLVSGSSNGLWRIYNPTEGQIQQFGAWLWSSDIIDQIMKMISNPMDAIIGLHLLYATPPTGGSATIKAGYLDSGVSSAVVSSQYTTIDCGSVGIGEYFHNCIDWDNTSVSIYLPFIGIVPLATQDVMNSVLHLTYRVDVLTGTCLAQINVTRGNSNGVLYTFNGNCAVQIPLTSGNYGTLLTGLLSAVGGVAATVATGGAALPAVAGIGSAMINSHTQVQQSGNLGSNAGAMGVRTPYVIVTRPVPLDANEYYKYYGYPANKTVYLGNMNGYTRVREVHFESATATDAEKSEIETLLKGGVIF